jgi:hypothetical protein
MTGGSGKSNLAVLQAAFPGSPVYSGDLTDDACKKSIYEYCY